MIDILTGTAFDAPKRFNRREDELTAEFPSSVSSRSRGLLALRAQNWRAGGGPKPWTNPYITDGLVAMWDGEQSEDLGSAWKDIVGGLTFSASAGTYPVAGDKCLSMTQSDGISADISSLGISQTADWTIEVVHKRTASGYNAYIVQVMSGTSSQFSPRYWGSYLLASTGSSVIVPSPSGAYSLPMTWNTGTVNQHAVTDYLGGVGRASGNIYVRAPTTVNLGKISNGYLIGNIYGVRIYNRALTAEEVAHNAAQDSERFGI